MIIWLAGFLFGILFNKIQNKLICIGYVASKQMLLCDRPWSQIQETKRNVIVDFLDWVILN